MISRLNSIKGVGVDIEDIGRFEAVPFKENPSFYTRIFTQDEIDYCMSQPRPSQHFAARFCAKEAFIKACGEKVADYRSMEVQAHHKLPVLVHDGQRHKLSLAHEKDKAIAFVVVKK